MRARFGLIFIITAFAAAAQVEQGKELNDRGLDALSHRDYAGAEKLLRDSIGIWTALGPQFEAHRSTVMMNLGDVLCAEGRWAEAASIFEQSLELSRHSLGPRNLRTIANANRLANAYLVTGEPQRAEPLYREALVIERELYPADLQTAHTLGGLASMHMRLRQLDVAIPEAEESLKITIASEGESGVEAGVAYSNVAQAHRLAGRTDRALPLLRKAEAILLRLLGPTHPRVASVISQEGLALLNEGKLALAEQSLVHAVDLLGKNPGATVELAVADYNLGLLRVRQKKYADADIVLTRALGLEEQYSARPGSEMVATLQMLSEVREKLHRFDDAARLKDRAATIMSYR